MRHRLDTLTDREKETLQFLLVGHDAKSIAVHLGLSVHTINERLRDARRKLGVSSSREAARFLNEAEQADPHSLANKQFGVSSEASDRPSQKAGQALHSAHRFAWFGGGMLIMSLIIAAAILTSVIHGGDASGPQRASVGAATATSHPAGLEAARDWIALLDQQRWQDSWDKASPIFQAGIPTAQWASKVQSVRQPLGVLSARVFRNATDATSLPGAPAGQYEIIQFQTNFAHKAAAVETVVLAHDATNWKVAGYFIK